MPDPQTAALILAGGLGTRLSAVVSEKPKVLAEVNGKPFLSVLMEQVAQSGIRHAVLCTGHKGDLVRSTFGTQFGALQLSYSHESSPLGTAGALRQALPLTSSDPVLGLNGDSYCEADLAGLLEWHRQKKAEGTLLLAQVPHAGRFGQVNTDDEGRILSFDEKGRQEGPGWISAGIYVLSRKLLSTVPEGRAVSIEMEMFPMWARDRLFGCRQGGRFLDIGTPESYSAAAKFFETISPPPPPSPVTPSASLQGRRDEEKSKSGAEGEGNQGNPFPPGGGRSGWGGTV